MLNNKFISAVIVAAGKSTRMNKGISKQMIPLVGKPVLAHTISVFISCKIIDEIIIVCPADNIENFKTAFSVEALSIPIKFAEGGETRQQSVRNGVFATSETADFVVIHDGARPLITPKLIEKVSVDALKYSSATLAVPVKDTIKTVQNGLIVSTPDRDTLMAIQTPQVFEKSIYLSALQTAEECKLDFTDDCQLIEHCNGKVHITIGSYSNIKITTPEDIAMAEVLINLRGDNLCE